MTNVYIMFEYKLPLENLGLNHSKFPSRIFFFLLLLLKFNFFLNNYNLKHLTHIFHDSI